MGNYYSDGTHTGSNGIGGTYTIATDNDDDYQLMQTTSNYSLQAWWLHSDNIMYRDDVTKAGGSIEVSNGGNQIWKADQAAVTAINFSGSDTWTGQLFFTSAPTNEHTFTVEIGSSTDGSDFTAGGPDATITGNGSATGFTFTTDASYFTVTTGKYLAFRITSNHAEYSVRTGGAWSYISSPDNSTDYAVPVELSIFTANVSNRIVTLNWQTETEVNNYGFQIERKSEIEKRKWEELGFIEGHGNSNSPKTYSFSDKNTNGSTIFYYRLKQIDNNGVFEYSDIIEVSLDKPTEYGLGQNYPNPFNPTTNIQFTLPEAGEVNLSLYNMLGEKVMELLNNKMEAGYHNVELDASDLSSGVYIYCMKTYKGLITKKMTLLR